MPFNIDSVNQQMASGTNAMASQIDSLMSKTASGQSLSEQDMLQLQNAMNKWNIMVSMQSNIQKTWADTLKNIVSNMR